MYCLQIAKLTKRIHQSKVTFWKDPVSQDGQLHQLSEDVIRDICSWPDILSDIVIDVTEFGLEPRLPSHPNIGGCYENDFLFQQQQEEPDSTSSPSTSHEASATQTGPEVCGLASCHCAP